MINLQDVSFQYYAHGNFVLRNINLALEPGHIYGLLGKNGVGKSTMFRLMTGLNKITSGTIRIAEADPWKHLPSMLTDIFLFPEEVHFPKMSVMKYASLYGAFYPNFSMDYLKSILSQLEVDPEQKMSTMSQGQRKKAYMAYALACNTRILLMDEPTNGLDIPSKTKLRNILSEHKSPERCIVISTHQVRDLECLIDGVIILDEAQLALLATADELFNRLVFGLIEDESRAIYSEKTVAGLAGISLRKPGEAPQTIDALNLETLFNAVISNRESIQNVLEAK